MPFPFGFPPAAADNFRAGAVSHAAVVCARVAVTEDRDGRRRLPVSTTYTTPTPRALRASSSRGRNAYAASSAAPLLLALSRDFFAAKPRTTGK